MSIHIADKPSGASKNRKRFRDRHPAAKAGIVLAWTLGALVFIILAAACAITWYLTPANLTSLLNRETSETINADVKASNVRFTLWSTFPHFCVRIDSIKVRSRNFDSLSPAQLRQLPEHPDFLLSTGPVSGEVNVLKLLQRKIWLSDLKAESLRLNLVAFSDSITNYDIWPDAGRKREVPFFTTTSLRISGPGSIDYYSAVSQTSAAILLEGLSAVRSDSSFQSYRIDLRGKVNARVKQLQLLSGFPFRLDGRADLSFDPFRIRLSDYDVSLGNTTGKVNMAVEFGQEMKMNNFTYRLDNFNLNRFLAYLPPRAVPFLSSLDADITVNASARLTSPYFFSSSALPSMVIDFNVPDGDISYRVSNGPSYTMRHIGAGARLVFTGENPDSAWLEIPNLRLIGEGADLELKGRISSLTGNPRVRLAVVGNADAAVSGRIIEALRPYQLKGEIATDAIVDFRLTDFRSGELANVGIGGDLSLRDFAFRYPGGGFSATGRSVDIDFGGKADELENNSLANGLFDLTAQARDVKAQLGDYSLQSGHLDISSSLRDRKRVLISDIASSLPVDLRVKAADLAVAGRKDTLDIDMDNVLVEGTIRTMPRTLAPEKLDFRLKGDRIDYHVSGTKIRLAGIDVGFDAGAYSGGIRFRQSPVPTVWTADAVRTATRAHSPEFLSVKLPPDIRAFLDRWRTHATLSVASGSLITGLFPIDTQFSDLAAEASLDSLVVGNININARATAARISGKISNLREFLCSREPAPLRIGLDLALDTVQINQLAGAYQRGRLLAGDSTLLKTHMPDSISPSDTVALMIPRNIIADIRASARETRYMDLRLYDLGTNLRLRNGILDIPGLHISSDFGTATLDFRYDTSDIMRLGMEAKLGIAQVNVVNFFKNFHTLLLMMPQMRNLSGILSAEAEGGMSIFPNMYIDIPSLKADIYVQGRGLKVHQDPFIRRIAKMMLIRDSSDIHIANMDVHASVHDNLLELYPFDFSFSRYKLNLMGLNNFDGKLYYHIGILKSPVPFPFGINITGMFHNPDLRFGGAGFKMKKGEEITSTVMEENRVNLMRELKYYLSEFIRKAAESDTAVN